MTPNVSAYGSSICHFVQAVALPEVQSVGEYEARYGAYNTQRHQQRPPEQGEEASRDSPIIFRHLHMKKSESRIPESAVQVCVLYHAKEFMHFRRNKLFLHVFISFVQSRL
jgi:hypothetical protein